MSNNNILYVEMFDSCDCADSEISLLLFGLPANTNLSLCLIIQLCRKCATLKDISSMFYVQ